MIVSLKKDLNALKNINRQAYATYNLEFNFSNIELNCIYFPRWTFMSIKSSRESSQNFHTWILL